MTPSVTVIADIRAGERLLEHHIRQSGIGGPFSDGRELLGERFRYRTGAHWFSRTNFKES